MGSRTNLVLFDSVGAHVIGTRVTFPRNVSGSYLHATRLPARAVGAKKKMDKVCAVDLLKQLDHPIPPLFIGTRGNICLATVSGSDPCCVSDALHTYPLGRAALSLPTNQPLGKTEFNKSSMSGVHAAAALAPGIIKHGKAVDINHLHISLGHVNAEILRQTAKHYGIRLTEE